MVEQQKVEDYLLNAAHPDNGGKAKFFEKLGFRRDNWQELAAAVKKLAASADVTSTEESPHGRKYVIVGSVESPSGKTATVQAVWIVDQGLETPRLVTAYPFQE